MMLKPLRTRRLRKYRMPLTTCVFRLHVKRKLSRYRVSHQLYLSCMPENPTGFPVTTKTSVLLEFALSMIVTMHTPRCTLIQDGQIYRSASSWRGRNFAVAFMPWHAQRRTPTKCLFSVQRALPPTNIVTPSTDARKSH